MRTILISGDDCDYSDDLKNLTIPLSMFPNNNLPSRQITVVEGMFSCYFDYSRALQNDEGRTYAWVYYAEFKSRQLTVVNDLGL